MSENLYVNQGRVGIRLDKSEYSVAPSGTIAVTVTLRKFPLRVLLPMLGSMPNINWVPSMRSALKR